MRLPATSAVKVETFLMKDRAALPERLLDINGLPNMARIEALPGGGVRIGALARMSDVAADTEV
jgi:xanthine dehydrogenase YagS FAD-binding subunit